MAPIPPGIGAIRIVRHLIDASSCRGPWWFGIRADGIRDAYAISRQPSTDDALRREGSRGHCLGVSTYERVVPVSAQQVEGDPGVITGELLGDLLHHVGAKAMWKGADYLG
jgi:hypothetical protein